MEVPSMASSPAACTVPRPGSFHRIIPTGEAACLEMYRPILCEACTMCT